MAELCFKCFKKLEPNANENNTDLSTDFDFCEGCGTVAAVVVEFNDGK